VPAQLGVRNLPEFLALLRASPGKYNFGSSGNGTFSHLSGELFKGQARVFMTHIPYRGTGLVFTDMMAGQIHMLIDNYVTAQPHIREGTLRAIGVTSLRRLPFAPDLPTLDEQGLKGFDVDNWFGIYGPRGAGSDEAACCSRSHADWRHTPADGADGGCRYGPLVQTHSRAAPLARIGAGPGPLCGSPAYTRSPWADQRTVMT